VSLGAPGDFDDMHLFAPCVLAEGGRFALYYCGSRGAVEERVFRVGLAWSTDGRRFEKDPRSPVFDFGDGRHSVLTPALLREGDGRVLREGGRLRMWFSATTFPPGVVHTLHETGSDDGIAWDPPSGAQLEGVYAPTVIRDGSRYLLWYTDVSADPWLFRHAWSADGRAWEVHPGPVLEVDQPWEHRRLFYPTVLKLDGRFLMWYGSYSGTDPLTTAIGFAESEDGIRWEKSNANPVFGPEPTNTWESHFTTSQSIVRLPDGALRMWYASRTKPPYVHKYFAIGTGRLERQGDREVGR
jgi:predicted GH43/DUF377 family glycosyl hydrolase